MIITNTPSIDGNPIKEYLGVITKCVAYTNIKKIPFDEGLERNFKKCEDKVKAAAIDMGADAVVNYNVVYRYDVPSLFYATGTAVKL